MIILTIVLFVILFLHEFGLLNISRKQSVSDPTDDTEPLPSTGRVHVDVRTEKNKVNSIPVKEMKKYSLVLRNVTKSYGSQAAVKEFCLAIER